jgi:hypothetical protein
MGKYREALSNLNNLNNSNTPQVDLMAQLRATRPSLRDDSALVSLDHAQNPATGEMGRTFLQGMGGDVVDPFTREQVSSSHWDKLKSGEGVDRYNREYKTIPSATGGFDNLQITNPRIGQTFTRRPDPYWGRL